MSGAHLVWSIMLRPKAVTEAEISRQGILPITAPVNPYTLLALTCHQGIHRALQCTSSYTTLCMKVTG
jgi:hypothetical protein